MSKIKNFYNKLPRNIKVGITTSLLVLALCIITITFIADPFHDAIPLYMSIPWVNLYVGSIIILLFLKSVPNMSYPILITVFTLLSMTLAFIYGLLISLIPLKKPIFSYLLSFITFEILIFVSVLLIGLSLM